VSARRNLMLLGGRQELDIEWLATASGGGGGGPVDASLGLGGGAGAGELRQGIASLPIGATISVSIAPPGAGGEEAPGNEGGDLVLSGALSLTLQGGGRGGEPDGSGGDGGSGGGGGNTSAGTSPGGASTATPPGVGHAGGGGNTGGAGGGGGAGGPGTSSAGAGVVSSITGSAVTYCRGGSPGSLDAVGDAPGNGGHGGIGSLSVDGKAGKAGTFIARYPGAARATGGMITSSGGYTIHTLANGETFTVTG